MHVQRSLCFIQRFAATGRSAEQTIFGEFFPKNIEGNIFTISAVQPSMLSPCLQLHLLRFLFKIRKSKIKNALPSSMWFKSFYGGDAL